MTALIPSHSLQIELLPIIINVGTPAHMAGTRGKSYEDIKEFAKTTLDIKTILQKISGDLAGFDSQRFKYWDGGDTSAW